VTNRDRHSWRFWVAWCALTAALLVLIPSAKWDLPLWALPDTEQQPFLLLVCGFVVAALVPVIQRWRGRTVSPGGVLLWTLAVFGLVGMTLALEGTHSSHRVLIEVPLLAAVLLPLSFGQDRGGAIILAALLAAVGALSASFLYGTYGPQPKIAAHVTKKYIKTAFYNLEADFYEGRIPRSAARGGGLTRIADQYLLATGDGHLYLFGWPANGGDLTVTPLPYRVPINGEEFAAAVGLPYEQPRGVFPVGDVGTTQVDTWRFHVSDILVQELGTKVRVFAGHHFWNHTERCFITRVSMAEADRAAFMSGSAKLDWVTLYDAKPCMPVEGPLRERTAPFEGNLSGGRLALQDPDSLLFTVGFHGFDGVNSRQVYSQDPDASWGTVVLIHVNAKTSETFTVGNRNEQGLYVDPKGVVWETEHGPQGGDELNMLKRGANYGWPYVSYGTDYGSLAWPLSKTQGRHDGYEEPIYSWVPSIGVSNLIGVERGTLFPIWQGDLLVASLRAVSLFRIRIVDHRAVFAEPIEIGQRVRALIEGLDGRIVLFTDDQAIVSIAPATTMSNELLFANMCGGCHKAMDGRTHMIGPDLAHVYGRKIASAEGYTDYSAALRQQSGRWDEQKLDRFLTNPQLAVPGTVMPFAGIPDPKQRAAIIDFLKSVK
jgi:cytochrome c2